MKKKRFQQDHWTKPDYQKLIAHLFLHSDIEYLKFNRQNIGMEPMLGVPVPILNEIADRIILGNVSEFQALNTHEYHETILLEGLVIAKHRVEPSLYLSRLEAFLPVIRNWAQCDYTVVHAKLFQTQELGEKGFIFARNCLKSDHSWTIRFGLVLLLSYYLDRKHIQEVLRLCRQIEQDDRCIQMAIAWLITAAYPGYPKKVLPMLSRHQLPIEVERMAYEKLKDSKRVTGELKTRLAEVRASAR